ncbi:MAG: S-layer homology domain-containing protein, partial [Oscillospiraceae bacterium]|nr:S-layer homology domain-containing protein [Oscillospiraceae bacterium]
NTPKGDKSINVTIIGSVITGYSRQGFDDDDGFRRYEPRLAKLSQQEVLAKAKESFKKINPDIYGECKFELRNLSLTSSEARIAISRNVNGIDVSDNGGSIRINQNTGELAEIDLTWWDGAKFSDPQTAKTEAEIKETYKSLCTLTPYYRISYKWDENAKKSMPTVRIVYSPDFTDEIDAYTGKASTIWVDMEKAGGSRYYGNVMYANPATGISYDGTTAEAGMADDVDDDVAFSEEELKKLEQNSKLLNTDQVTALLKNDKFVALTDNYKLKNYNVSSQKDTNGKESFTMYVSYELGTDKPAANEHYKYINVNVDAESGKILSLNKYGETFETDDFAKLDVKKANAVAEEVSRSYAKDIISGYKADKSNTEPVKTIGTIAVWDNETNKKVTEKEYEKSRTFRFNRFENGIQVSNNTIRITVDSNGTVTYYDVDHAENITFPKADIISTDEAFKKLFEQMEFQKYYEGWITKDGEFKTYLLYDIGSFTLNAKTGKICNWDGSTSDTSSMGYHTDAKYSDIKDIPQREAILEMQKYGVTLRTDGKKFLPDTPISEDEFANLLGELFNEAVAIDYAEEVFDDSPEGKAKAKAAEEAAAKDRAETTRREAAVIFAQMYDHNKIAEIKGIFRSFYSDIKSSDENAGHIAIAYAKGFFGKTADGKFHGDKVITRAEAMQLVYDYLKLLSK